MIRRVLVFILEVFWVAAWGWHFGAGWALAVMALAGLAAGLTRRRGGLAVLAWLAGLGAGVLTAGAWGAGLAVYALWRGASPPNPDRPAIYERLALAIAGLAALTFAAPSFAWTLPVILLVGLVAALEANRDPSMDPTPHLRLAGVLALVGAAAGLVAVGLVLWSPWQVLDGLGRLLVLAIGHLAALVSHPLHLPGAKQHSPQRDAGRNPFQPHAGKLTSPWPVYAALAVLAAVLAYFGVRALSHLGLPAVERTPGLDREQMDVNAFARRYGTRATLTRRVVQLKMRVLGRNRSGPRAGETVREWLRRLYGSDEAAAVAPLYEEVRYGGVADDVGRSRRAYRLWPRRPESGDRGEDAVREDPGAPPKRR